MIITYEIGDNLYLNITNQCPNACEFCIRTRKDAFRHDLWLEREPTAAEISRDIFSRDLSRYRQLVFCGFGEPLTRLEAVLQVCGTVKAKSTIPIRINTNGLANQIYRMDITSRFKSLVDGVSISLNAGNAEAYDAICHSIFGREAFPAILDFTQKCKAAVQDVQLSVVDCLPPSGIAQCRKIAADLGVNLKIRKEVKDSK
jgi:TatD family-associated radical SAM protein